MSSILPSIIDTHAHLDDAAFDIDRAEVLQRGRVAGVRRILNIAYRPGIWERSVALRDANPDVELAAGIHPQDAASFDAAHSDTLAERLLAMRPLGIGEAGFDFARPGPSHAQQEAAFRWQIELAIDTNRPLIIHQREASTQLVRELDRWPNARAVVLHSFDGDDGLAAWAREREYYVGIGGLACRKSSQGLRAALSTIAAEKLLLETDSPYLAPPGASSRRNEPANLPLVAEILAAVWDLTPNELREHTTRNALTVFGFTALN